MKTYSYNYKEGIRQGNGIMEANSPSDVAYKIGRSLGYQVKQSFQGNIHRYISEVNNFDTNAPLCIAVMPCTGKIRKTKYYLITQ